MNVILLEPLAKLGELGEEVSVKPGYARNYLLPQGKAVRATNENREKFEARRVALQQAAQDRLGAAEERAQRIRETHLSIVVKAGEEGKLFGSVGTQDIANALTEQGIDAHKREVQLPDGAIRQLGDYEITLQLHSDVNATLALSVIAE